METNTPNTDFDRLHRATTRHGNIRAAIVKATGVIETARTRHGLSLQGSVVLGRALAGVMLLASNLKGEERININIQGNGAFNTLYAEANRVGEMRGYINNPLAEVPLDGQFDIGKLLMPGTLSVTKTLYNHARPVTSVVELIDGNISQDLTNYCTQSDQIPTAIILDVHFDTEGRVDGSGGILVQAMPGATEEEISMIEERIHDYQNLGERIADGHDPEEILDELFGDVELDWLSRTPLHFYCRCNKEQFVHALEMLSIEDLESMRGEEQQLICHYCNEHYTITQIEIERLIVGYYAKMN